MKVVTTEEMRRLDARTINEYDTPCEVLMGRAGLGVAGIVADLCDVSGWSDASICLVAGRGNNGGDAFAAACFLDEDGFDVEVWVAGSANEIKDDSLKHMSRMQSAGIPLREFPTKEDWDAALAMVPPAEIIVDGVLGTGIQGPARGPAAGAIRYINTMAEHVLVVAIDIPSGLDSDTGKTDGDAVMADVTITMGLPKKGLIEPLAADYVGTLEVVDIGIPEELYSDIVCDVELIGPSDLRGLFRRRRRRSHKGDYGHVLIIGGAAGFSGAVTMAAMAALRSGAGLVSAIVPRGIVPTVSSVFPEIMVHAAEETEQGSLSFASASALLDGHEFDALLVGPGMSQHPDSGAVVRHVLDRVKKPVVLDADALNVISGDAAALKHAACPLVITPHPGEMSRLLGMTKDELQSDRQAAARHAVEKTGAVTVLKGCGTLVLGNDGDLYVNMTGNPGMATAGCGDVLAGMVAGFIAQAFEPVDAARAAVYMHGRSGDNVAWRGSQAGLTAADLLDEIPFMIRELSVR